ncbi:MAG: ribonuclease D [Pseudomonadota bacterium]
MMRWHLVESDTEAASLMARCQAAQAVMLDTEFMRRNTFYPQVGLLQLCCPAEPETAWLVDPLLITDLEPLKQLLADSTVVKVLHSASEDLEVFDRWLSVLPQPLFDTQRAASLLGLGFGLGYRTLVQEVCGVDLPKGETRSNWLQRPLSNSQCEYAAQDVTWLLSIWRDLDKRARAEQRNQWILSDGDDALAAVGSNSQQTHTRIKSAWKLNRRQLAALQAVCQWREETARTRDKPRSWIIDDKTCLLLAQLGPVSMQALSANVQLPAPVQRRYGKTLLALLEGVAARSPETLPPSMPVPLDAAQRRRLGDLKKRGETLSEKLGVAPQSLLSGADYELLLRETLGQPIREPRPWQGWRSEVVIGPLRRALAEGGGSS